MSAAPQDPMRLHGEAGQPSRTDAILGALGAVARWDSTRVHRAITNRITLLVGMHPVPGYKIAVLALAADHAADMMTCRMTACPSAEFEARHVVGMIAERCGHNSVEHHAVIDALADVLGISSEFVVAQPPLFGPTQCPCVCDEGQIEYVGDGDNNHWCCGHCGLQRACESPDREDDR